MKAGSIVECIDNTPFSHLVKLNVPYTVKAIAPKGMAIGTVISNYRKNMCVLAYVGIMLEETDHSMNFMGEIFQVPFPIENFRELLPPMDISIESILEEPELS